MHTFKTFLNQGLWQFLPYYTLQTLLDRLLDIVSLENCSFNLYQHEPPATTSPQKCEQICVHYSHVATCLLLKRIQTFNINQQLNIL